MAADRPHRQTGLLRHQGGQGAELGRSRQIPGSKGALPEEWVCLFEKGGSCAGSRAGSCAGSRAACPGTKIDRMFYREYPPPPALRNHIQCFWALEHDYCDSFHSHEHLWADTQTELIFSHGKRYYRLAGNERSALPESFVIGPFKKELLLYSDGLTGFVAVRFHPWGFAAFSKKKMTELINAILPLEEVVDSYPSLPGQPVTNQVGEHLEILASWLLQQQRQQPVAQPIAEKI